MDMASEEFIEDEYNTNDPINLTLEDGLTTNFHGFDLNIDLGDVDDHLPLVVWLSHAQYHAKMLSHSIMHNLKFFNIHDVMKFEKILERLKNMRVANCSKQHQRTLSTFLYLICE